jgi:DNA-binding NtrC family response regulator
LHSQIHQVERTAVTQARDIDLLFVDDDEDFRTVAARRFEKRGFRVAEAANGEAALAAIQRKHFDVAVVDMRMPGMSGLELLEKLKAADPECEAIILTGEGTIETAVQAMKLGALDYLTKPFSLAELEEIVNKAYERHRLRQENIQLKAVLSRTEAIQAPRRQMVGASAAIQGVYRLIEKAGPTDKAILIQGASGTGKELVARALHEHSGRADRPMVVINCAALPETLLESELFGHEKGAFTGAITAKPGLFELADGGTLFIDEIGEMPTPLQAKLLRVLEDGSMRRVGSLKERRVNVRLLVATNRELAKEVQAGRFREDLYYRIDVMTINLPPLKDRAGDIPLLIRHFLGSDWEIEADALAALERYHWPGNVRQLINVIDRAKILAEDQRVGMWDLPADIADAEHPAPTAPSQPVHDDLAGIEKAHVLEVLKRERGNKARAARALGVSRRSLYRLLEKHAINVNDA